MRDYAHVTFIGGSLDLSRRVLSLQDASMGRYLVQCPRPVSDQLLARRRVEALSYATDCRVEEYSIRQLSSTVWVGILVDELR